MQDACQPPLDTAAPPVTLRPAAAGAALAAAILALLALHLVSQVIRFRYGYEYQMGFHDRVYFGAEFNLPTWFSSSVILVCGLVMLWIARATYLRRVPGAIYWAVLGVIVVGLSMDEAAAFHELLSPVFAGPMVGLGDTLGGIFVPLGERAERYAWVIPGSIATLVLGLAFLRFLRMLPARTRRLFVAAGLVFLAGALGFEVLGGRYSGLYDPDNPGFVVLMTLEETCEMAGMSLFLYALLGYVQSEFGAIRLDLGTPGASRLARAA